MKIRRRAGCARRAGSIAKSACKSLSSAPLCVRAASARCGCRNRFPKGDYLFRQNRHAVFRAFAVAHRDLPAFKIQILDAQPQSFQQTQSRAVASGTVEN
jgi:hypothetical protein